MAGGRGLAATVEGGLQGGVEGVFKGIPTP